MKLAISGKLCSGKTTIANQFDAKVIAIGNSIKKTAGFLIEEPLQLREYLDSTIGKVSDEIYQNYKKNTTTISVKENG